MQMNTDAEKYIDPLSDILMNIPEGTTGSSIVSSIMSLSSALVYRDYTVESIVVLYWVRIRKVVSPKTEEE